MTPDTPDATPDAAPDATPARLDAARPLIQPDDRAVATGDRRGEFHYESDPDQLVVARATMRPGGPIPPEDRIPHPEAVDPDAPPVEDVRVMAPAPSVWDARPAEP